MSLSASSEVQFDDSNGHPQTSNGNSWTLQIHKCHVC